MRPIFIWFLGHIFSLGLAHKGKIYSQHRFPISAGLTTRKTWETHTDTVKICKNHLNTSQQPSFPGSSSALFWHRGPGWQSPSGGFPPAPRGAKGRWSAGIFASWHSHGCSHASPKSYLRWTAPGKVGRWPKWSGVKPQPATTWGHPKSGPNLEEMHMFISHMSYLQSLSMTLTFPYWTVCSHHHTFEISFVLCPPHPHNEHVQQNHKSILTSFPNISRYIPRLPATWSLQTNRIIIIIATSSFGKCLRYDMASQPSIPSYWPSPDPNHRSPPAPPSLAWSTGRRMARYQAPGWRLIQWTFPDMGLCHKSSILC